MGEFTRFYQENHSLVVSLAQRRLSNPADAEDIASDAFRVAWTHFSQGNELSVPWLYGVVQNLVGNEYRRRTRHPHLPLLDDDGPAAHSSDPDDDLWRLVDGLPHAHKQVLLMTYWDGFSTEEIARILGTSGPAIRTRLTRARRALRAELDATNPSPREDAR